jgi:F-type H+-transporting ATPase subunit b
MEYQEVAMDPTVLVTIAAGDSHPIIDFDYTVVVQLALFLVLFFVANKLLFQPYLRLREKRQAGIEGARHEAERMSAEADTKLADYERQLASARARAADEQRTIRAQAAAYEREVTDKARSTAQAATESAQSRVRSETETARKELLPQAQTLARSMASRLLGREVA